MNAIQRARMAGSHIFSFFSGGTGAGFMIGLGFASGIDDARFRARLDWLDVAFYAIFVLWLAMLAWERLSRPTQADDDEQTEEAAS